MRYKAILFDLDGTLHSMDPEKFIKRYFGLLAEEMSKFGYDPQQLFKAIWKGTESMIKNDGRESNEKVFWRCFAEIFGQDSLKDIVHFDNFYETRFDLASDSCGQFEDVAETIAYLKNNGYRLVIASNPVFPRVAIKKRIVWAGLNPDDFEYITSYENSSFCKPNPEYYSEICKKIGVPPEDCLMVGNDVSDDMPAKLAGTDVFLLPADIINRENIDIDIYPHGNFADLIAYINR